MADVISGTRKLLEDLLYRVRVMELRGQDARPRVPEDSEAHDPEGRFSTPER